MADESGGAVRGGGVLLCPQYSLLQAKSRTGPLEWMCFWSIALPITQSYPGFIHVCGA